MLTAAQTAGASPATAASLALALAGDPYQWAAPAGSLGETFPRWALGNGWGPTSGVLNLSAVSLTAGEPISEITIAAASSASGQSHWWLGIWGQGLTPAALSADQLTASFPANQAITLNIASTGSGSVSAWTPVRTGLHYIGFAMVASGMPNLLGPASNTNVVITGLSPSLGGASTTGLSGLPSFGAAAIAPTTSQIFYAYVS